VTEYGLELAMKMTWTFTTDLFPELCGFGMHTGLRDVGDYVELTDVMVGFTESLEGIMSPCTGASVTLSGWSDVGFTGWHQLFFRDQTAQSIGSGAEMPHQLAAVVGYVNASEPGVPVGRRRNRTYIGPLSEATLEADGRLSETSRDALMNAVTAFDTALRDVNWVGGGQPGLLVVSPTAEAAYEANEVKVGLRYDVHRSRAQKTTESPDTATIPV
jgi:hypothetical protein